jgi:hypothetical protein
MKVSTIVTHANDLRTYLGTQETAIREYVEAIKQVEDQEGFNRGECIAHAMIALRSVEDARMRIGKVIQYADGGESIYDKK